VVRQGQNDRMRVFAALNLPEGLADTLQPVLPEFPADVRAIPEARWHLTLAFYGDADDGMLGCLQRKLQRRLGRWSGGGIRVRVSGGGAFRGGVGYLAVTGANPDADRRLRDLARECSWAGRGCDAPGTEEQRRFRAHITVARARRGTTLPGALRAALAPVAAAPWLADRVLLVASHLGAEPRYEVLRSFPLRP
jgi:2'-5' RNA ligase